MHGVDFGRLGRNVVDQSGSRPRGMATGGFIVLMIIISLKCLSLRLGKSFLSKNLHIDILFLS